MGASEPVPSAVGANWVPEPVRGQGDAEIARLAGLQWAVVTRDQLLAAGIGHHAIAHRVAHGRLTLLHGNVYLVGRPSRERFTAEMAAALLSPGHTVVSHDSAAAAWGTIDRVPEVVTLTVVGRDLRSRPGIHIHRTQTLDPRDVRLLEGLPVTAPARALLDLAGSTSAAELERAVAEARVQRLILSGDLEAALDRAPGRTGATQLRGLLRAEGGPGPTRRELEHQMLTLIRDAQLPLPQVNPVLLGFEVDFLWPEHRLVIETDGHQFHGHRMAFERDRKRDQILVAAGYRVMRITWRQLREEPLAVIARLTMALAVRAA